MGHPDAAWEPGRKAMTKLHGTGKWQARRCLLQLLAAQSPTGQRLVQMRRLSGSPMCPLCGGKKTP